MTTTKDPAELAWEAAYPDAAQMAHKTHPASLLGTEARDRRAYFKTGYHAAMAQQDAATRAAKREAWAEGLEEGRCDSTDFGAPSPVNPYSDPEAKPNV